MGFAVGNALGRKFTSGNAAAVQHGAYSVRRLAAREAEIAEELRQLVPVRSAADEPAVRLLALQLARIEAVHEYLGEHGLWDGQGQPRPLLRVISTWENSAARLMDRLGLTPTSRAALGVDLARGELALDALERLAKRGRQIRERRAKASA